MKSLAAIFPLLACATPTSVIEIPPCADRVELEGQAERLSNNRFELDHTFDFAFSRTQLSFQAGGRVRDFVIPNNQPDPLRLFVGVGSGVVGALLLGTAVYDVTSGAQVGDRPFYLTLSGTGLMALGAGAAVTGWHPQRRVTTFPGACDGAAPAPAAAEEPPAPPAGQYDR